ncbi:class I SAM-dependent methyltransferase [Paenibacillus glycinis]|uniref:Methyltransferase domain-containing protein n=1 Tax=Paenibacillus glycinis TaxID=2697035 RepID=A0ABW9XU04_9BACL|nr:class I SAM-dependent methyltransferase [Paenibacillus glycinis]NBD25797.1 methyltransferase domain-containing protein [Paenibacillus glycinis]
MPCPLCAAADSRLFAVYERHKLETCASCGLVYQDPGKLRGGASLIEEIYDEAWVAMREQYGHFTFMNHAVFNALLLDMVAPAKGKLLEIGSGTGEFLYMARCGGWDVVGIEPSAAACAYASAKYGLPLNRSPWNRELAASGGPYQAIAAWHVLEHLDQPVAFMREAASLLSPDGVIAFSVPNRRSLMNMLHGMRSALYAEVDHLCHFDLANIRQLASAAGIGIRMLFTRQYVHGFEDLLAAHPVFAGLSLEQRMGLIARLQGEGAGHEIVCAAYKAPEGSAIT